jgi:hypothetical protein
MRGDRHAEQAIVVSRRWAWCRVRWRAARAVRASWRRRRAARRSMVRGDGGGAGGSRSPFIDVQAGLHRSYGGLLVLMVRPVASASSGGPSGDRWSWGGSRGRVGGRQRLWRRGRDGGVGLGRGRGDGARIGSAGWCRGRCDLMVLRSGGVGGDGWVGVGREEYLDDARGSLGDVAGQVVGGSLEWGAV